MAVLSVERLSTLTKVASGVRTKFGRNGMPNFCAGGSPIPRVSGGGGPRLDEQEAGRSLPFAIVSLADGVIVGSTRYGNIDRPNRHVEIGWTWVAPRWQRTAINAEAKLMLLRHAFETLGCIRVEFKTDRLNEQSRTALKRIGAVEEGEHPRRGVARHPGDTGGGFESACRSGPAPVARRPCESRNVTNDQTAKCQGCRTLAPIKSKPRKGIRLALAGVPLGKSGGKWGGPWRESSMSAGRRSGADRRDNGRRNSEERRRQVIPVAVERRSGIDRRMELDRRTGMDRRVISDRRQALRPPSRERARV
jgi:hypothetical protein